MASSKLPIGATGSGLTAGERRAPDHLDVVRLLGDRQDFIAILTAGE